MKKLISLLSVFLIVAACSPEEYGPEITYEAQPIQNVTLPDTIAVYESNDIVVEYLKPTTCHGFNGFLYQKDGFTRTIAVQTFYYPNSDCQVLTNEVKQETLKFQPTSEGTYTFKFWQGRDANGDDIFLEIERPSKVY